jgi:hypothetical protein
MTFMQTGMRGDETTRGTCCESYYYYRIHGPCAVLSIHYPGLRMTCGRPEKGKKTPRMVVTVNYHNSITSSRAVQHDGMRLYVANHHSPLIFQN